VADLETVVTLAAARLEGAGDVVARTEAERAERTVADREQEAAAFARAADLRRRRDGGWRASSREHCSRAWPAASADPRSIGPAVHADPVSADDVTEATDAGTRHRAGARGDEAWRRWMQSWPPRPCVPTGAVETAETELAVARAEQDAATAAQSAARRRTSASPTCGGRPTGSTTIAGLAAREVEAGEHLALARQVLAAAQDSIAQARGAFPTVAARLDDAAARIAAAQMLAAAIEERESRSEAASAARAEQQEALTVSPFDDVTAAGPRCAARSTSPCSRRIAAHAAERTKERAILLDLELHPAGRTDRPGSVRVRGIRGACGMDRRRRRGQPGRRDRRAAQPSSPQPSPSTAVVRPQPPITRSCSSSPTPWPVVG
jgi:exonuclease SbcC